MATCRTCDAPVTWAITKTGKRMPIDPIPVVGGNVELEGETAVVVTPSFTDGVKRYVSHFVSCPDAAKHRKKK